MERKVKSIKCLMQDMQTRIKIDLSFYPIYRQYTWFLDNRGYVRTSITKNGKKTFLYLAHLVLKFDTSIDRKLICDHKNRNPLDNRAKNLRIVNHEIQSKNVTCRSNTNVLGIHLDKENKCYMVGYTINNIPDNKAFYFGVKKNKYQYDAWLEAKELNTYIRTTEPSYRLAACLDDVVSSDGESINEEVYLNKPNFERLSQANTSEHKHISLHRKIWVLRYFDEYGGEEKRIGFSFGPRSRKDKESALKEAVEFKSKFEKYRPKKGCTRSEKTVNTKKDLISSSEDTSNESGENSNMEEDDCSSNSDTITMSEAEIEDELVKIKNSAPVPSIYKGVDLDIEHNRYIVTYFDGYTHIRYCGFGLNEKYDHWMVARVVAENFKDEIDKIL
jgi:hypothetical protein